MGCLAITKMAGEMGNYPIIFQRHYRRIWLYGSPRSNRNGRFAKVEINPMERDCNFFDLPAEERAEVYERACELNNVENFYDLLPEERASARETALPCDVEGHMGFTITLGCVL